MLSVQLYQVGWNSQSRTSGLCVHQRRRRECKDRASASTSREGATSLQRQVKKRQVSTSSDDAGGSSIVAFMTFAFMTCDNKQVCQVTCGSMNAAGWQMEPYWWVEQALNPGRHECR